MNFHLEAVEILLLRVVNERVHIDSCSTGGFIICYNCYGNCVAEERVLGGKTDNAGSLSDILLLNHTACNVKEAVYLPCFVHLFVCKIT